MIASLPVLRRRMAMPSTLATKSAIWGVLNRPPDDDAENASGTTQQ
jgi:hypothetical protein